ncbi:MAG TPA: amino acid permease [Gemmatimonadaceae bacterium]|nr:amino acid permease [Gemmatimonadaceae bacterium]
MTDPTPTGASPDSALVRVLGVWGLAAGIVNVTIGGGIFRLPSGVAAALGAAAPVAYVVCALAMGLIVLCFAEAGSRVAMTGGPYAYVEVAFGPFVGFLTGALLWVGITLALAAVSTFFADSLGALLPSLGAGGRRTMLVLVLAGLAAANARGVAGVVRFNVVATVAKLLPLLLLVVVGAFAMRAENLHVAAPPTAGAVARASVLLIFAFLGVESALVPSGEVRDPARTVPRAVFLAMGAVALLYVVVQIVAQGILGPALAGDATPLATAAGAAMGPAGRTLILVGSTVSMFGYVSGMTLAVPRMLFAFARDGFLPAPLAAVHPRWRTPHVAIVVQVAIVLALALFGNFERLAVAANVTVLLVYAACCVAAAELRRRDVRAGGVPFRVPAAGVVPWLALAVIAWILWGLKLEEWIAAGLIVVAAVVVYLVTIPARRSRAAERAAAAAAIASA